jgi:uncharacterized protein YbjQ (UPF0145 family)
MGISDLFRTGPFMLWPAKLANAPWNVFKQATYQIVPSPHGVPMVQLELDFLRPNNKNQWGVGIGRAFESCVRNPEMSLAILLDNSGSMSMTYAEGHAYNCCWSILNHVRQTAEGFDLTFYNHRPSFVGQIKLDSELRTAIRSNSPNGGTTVTSALSGAIERYHRHRGMYIIVITDGAFDDKQQVQYFITSKILPAVTPDHPYAYRLHFVGAGEGADEKFLRQLEQVCAGQGIQLVTSHHHAHLSHSHEDMLDELDRAYLGAGRDFEIGEAGFFDGSASGDSAIFRVGNIATGEWRDGAVGSFNFLPRHMLIGLEIKPVHPDILPIEIRFRHGWKNDFYRFNFDIPLPDFEAAYGLSGKLVWPILRSLQRASSGQVQQEELDQKIKENHQAELHRQAKDLEALSRGDIPVTAKTRLAELRASTNTDEHLFSSNLAPDELALLRKHGYRPLGMVSGSAIYHVGAAFASLEDCEVKQLTHAYDAATELAVSRLEQEVRALGAHGVIGVRLKLTRHEWGEKTIEVQAVGTAITSPRETPKRPWLSDLSGQEWWALHRAGYSPVALVWGHCSWFVLTTREDQQIWQSWSNKEFTHWSDALSSARTLALKDIKERTKEAGGAGITGVRIERRLSEVELVRPQGSWDPIYSYKHHNLLVSIIGTAIRPREDAPAKVRGTVHVLSLKDGKLRPAALKQESDFQIADEAAE